MFPPTKTTVYIYTPVNLVRSLSRRMGNSSSILPIIPDQSKLNFFCGLLPSLFLGQINDGGNAIEKSKTGILCKDQ